MQNYEKFLVVQIYITIYLPTHNYIYPNSVITDLKLIYPILLYLSLIIRLCGWFVIILKIGRKIIYICSPFFKKLNLLYYGKEIVLCKHDRGQRWKNGRGVKL